MTQNPGIEFSICTYNRLTFLKECVQILLEQLNSDRILITVIDNNSTDDTREWVMEKMSQYTGLRYIHEPLQGLSVARNRAWRDAIYDWVFYIDDDCLPPDNFVSTALQLVNQDFPYDAFGGPVVAVYKGDIPDWLPDGFGSFSMAFKEVTVIDKGFIRGGCFMARRSVLEELGGFNPRLGVSGNELHYGEEIELQMRMRKAGNSIAYAPSLRTGHFVRTDKLQLKWVLKSAYARRRDKMFFDPVAFPIATLHLLRTLAGRLIWTPIHLLHCLTDKSYSFRKACFEISEPLAYRAGEFVGSFRKMMSG